jgi:hypothetical protein
VTGAATASLPPLVVWLGEAMFTFSPGRDITVGRGADTDIRVDIAAKQAISRVHMVLRADTTQWVAVDKSRNGIYADARRASTVPIDDDTRITLGAPDGPPLTFRITTQKLQVAQIAAPRPVPGTAPWPQPQSPATPPRDPRRPRSTASPLCRRSDRHSLAGRSNRRRLRRVRLPVTDRRRRRAAFPPLRRGPHRHPQ